jgi:hypothetical protein
VFFALWTPFCSSWTSLCCGRHSARLGKPLCSSWEAVLLVADVVVTVVLAVGSSRHQGPRQRPPKAGPREDPTPRPSHENIVSLLGPRCHHDPSTRRVLGSISSISSQSISGASQEQQVLDSSTRPRVYTKNHEDPVHREPVTRGDRSCRPCAYRPPVQQVPHEAAVPFQEPRCKRTRTSRRKSEITLFLWRIEMATFVYSGPNREHRVRLSQAF